jgi:A/G-specific adenine glycosylase
MSWYRKNSRALPWRSEPTPYRVWISEVMLQQTQASTASEYYIRFLNRFPDLESLAKAAEQEVLALWAGLGYYSRAQNLLKAAREIIQRHSGIFPSDIKTILSLPGIGRYTAGAICSIAFNQSQPIVDGNIRRVLSRFNGIINHAPESYFWNQMQAWIPGGKAAIFNQAMMELGALICIPRQPRCAECPIKKHCIACRDNLQNRLPLSGPKNPIRKFEMVILVLQRRGKILIVNNMPDFIPGDWGLPCGVLFDTGSIEETAKNLSRALCGSSIPLAYCAKIPHAIGHRRIAAHLFTGDASGPIHAAPSTLRWMERSQSFKILTSSLFLKAVKKMED